MRDERGLSGSVQVSLLLPVVIGIFLLAVQWAMMSWAQTTAHAAAQDAARAAAAYGATEAAGKQAAHEATTNGSLTDVLTTVHRRGETTSATVTGRALVVVPFFPTDIRAEATTPTERLTDD
uniref:TadE/TadG family type IV pilus assembly protein n=1 Tax=Tessaracoccus timonensis TaxID=2161816 RepID=UPI000D553274|nr:TadE/TadG family type IV pilus assembly protein [Tessaracoccus timonensis]